MNVGICKDPSRWDAYVESVDQASNYHRWGWREAIENTFGHEAYYLTAEDIGIIRGALPLFRMKSHVFGNFLISLPFFSYGGLLSDTPEARDALVERAAELARELGASHIELRQGSEEAIGWHDTTAKVTMELPLPASADMLWKSLSSGMRNKIRSAQKNNLKVQWGGAESVGVFYRIFSINMRNLGTPVYPERWFANLCRQFPDQVKILTLWDKEQAVASGVVTCFRKTLELPWSATLPESRRKYSAVFLYWALLEWAIAGGYRRADFGRCTKGSGVYEFKRHWNSVERPLHWYYWLAPGSSVPELRPDNPRYRLATSIWKRLPLAVANSLGPRIVRSIP